MKNLEDYEIMPIFPMQPVSNPQISPDGTKVLFTYTTVNMAENKYDSHIWLLDLEDGKPRQFTHGKYNDTYPRWSPDGKEILFLSNRTSEEDKAEEKRRGMQVWVIPANGGEAKRLTSVEGGVQRPMWSSDGNAVIFYSRVFKGEKGKNSDVKRIKRIKYKRDGGGFFQGEWMHLFSIPSKGGSVKQLTEGEFDVGAMAISPEGKNIAIVANLEEDADYTIFKNIYLVPMEGGKPKLLLKDIVPMEGHRSSEGALGWSPDGKYLAYVMRNVDDPDLVWFKKTDLWVLPLEGGKPKNLTADFDRSVGAFGELKWSPDSKYIYFRIGDHGSSHICRINLEGEVEKITKGKRAVGGFSMDDSGSIFAFTASDVLTPSELWMMDENGMKPLTEMNKELLNKLRLSKPEEFWFTASDGVEVQGWIVKPQEYKEGEKYPTIIEIHGGPRGAYSHSLSTAAHEFQTLADNGFVVVYTNPRASTGYGEEFAAEISGHWGERDYEDIMEAIDYVIKTYPYVDADKLGVAGGSYGGFMTNWIIGHTGRFKAAVSCRSISNWYSFHGTSDIGWMCLPTHEISGGKTPWDNLEVIMEKSPITYVNNMNTPLLLIHSEQDFRCPMEQAEQLFTALKKLRRVVELVRFPGGSHGLSRSGRPTHRVERLQHIVRWFDTYLKGN